LPPHAELYRRVRDLGGGVYEEVFGEIFEAVPVARLPPPHNPARCLHHERFERLEREGSGVRAASHEAALQVGEIFLATLAPNDIRACPYHKAGWRAIADESLRIIEAFGPSDTERYFAEALKAPFNDRDKGWLTSLFDDPIFIGGGSYRDGQHRGCALRFSGADRAAVVTGDEFLREECTDWTYQGDG
jgi:hypothetical protein